MRKKKMEEHENLERWLISYADFITLLFAFFVVMYSISAINEGKLRTVSEAINAAFNPFIAFSSTNIKITREQSSTEIFKVDMNLYLQVVPQIKKIDETGQRIKVVKDRRGIVIRIADNVIFETGRAEVLTEAEAALDKIAGLIRNKPNPILIEGHTDNIPIRTAAYPSNWELSTARAVSVMRYFTERKEFEPDRFSVAGYAEYRPVASNDTLEGRAANRRVDIVLLNDSPQPAAENSESPSDPLTGAN